MDLLSSIEHNILSRRLFKRGQRVLIAVSGGLDSMVLLRVLRDLSGTHDWSLRVAHLNHCLRGRSSDADERLVRQACATLKLPVTVERIEIRKLSARKKLSIEMAAREARHDFLARTAVRHQIPTVALAHHADDQVELFFLRLLRGSGAEGLGGMRWRGPSPANARVTLVRPLLDQPKSVLAAFAKAARVQFREDASNSVPDFLRNRIRNELLPLLRRKYQPALNRTVLRLMEIATAESDFVAESLGERISGRSGGAFGAWPAALQRRWLQRQLAQLSIAPDFQLVEELRLQPGRPVSICPGTVVMCGADGRVQAQRANDGAPEFRKRSVAVSFANHTGGLEFENVHFSWVREPVRRFRKPTARLGVEVFDADRVGPRGRLRHWRPGDRFQPIGMRSAVKLQDLFTNEKVLRKRRHELILGVTEQDEVFWVEGLRISERFKLTKSAKSRLIWRWKR